MTVSQAPVVSEAPSGGTPAAGGASIVALPSAVQDLARFFLSLSGSSSLGAVGGVAGVAASGAGSGVQLCPSTSAGGAVTVGAAAADPAGASGPPSASAAVTSMSSSQQRQEASRSGRRRHRSSSDGTDRRSKKRPRVGLLSLDLLIVGSGTIALLRALLRMNEPLPLLLELDVRLEVHLAILAPLQLMTARRVLGLQVGLRGRLREHSIFDQALVVDPLLLRELRMTSGLVPSIRWTSIGMTPSDQSWASSGAFMPWKSLQGSHQLGAGLLMHRLVV